MVSRSPKRTLEWFTTHARAQTVTSGGQTANSMLALDPLLRKGATITRIIMQLTLQGLSTGLVGICDWGIVVLNGDAVIAQAFPDADVSSDRADWLARGQESVVTSVVSDGSQLVRVFRDLRAQRVIRSEEDELHFIMDQNTSGMTVQYDLFSRILVRLR